MNLLRFATAGSVDDGKSTLIGRLLFDTQSIMTDQLEAIEAASSKRGDEYVNLALLTDGLRAEREQGITIDVAYRYFTTPKRKFIISDCPGHIQYTRNMVTGVSTTNLVLLLVDARKGLLEQTKRHCFVASLLRIPHLVICINKIDLVDYKQERFEEIKRDFEAFSKKLEIYDVNFIPVSALNGDNIVNKSSKTPWYKGSTLLQHLEDVHISSDENYIDFRLPIQSVIRPQSKEKVDYRGYCGQVISGSIRKSEKVTVLPSGFETAVKKIEFFEKEIPEAVPGQSIVIQLENEIDISRGDMLVRKNNQPKCEQDLEAMICWFNSEPLEPSKKFIIKHTTNEAQAIIKEINYKININELSRDYSDKVIGLNDFSKIKLRCSKPLLHDAFKNNRGTGSFILIDSVNNQTVAAGMIL